MPFAIGALISKLLSPRGIIYSLLALAVIELFVVAFHFVENYAALERNNVILTSDVQTEQQALLAQQKSEATQQKLDQTNLTVVEEHYTQSQVQLSDLQSNIYALQSLRKPTNEDYKCVDSPYISLILNRLRSDASAGNPTTSKNPSYAHHTRRTHHTSSKTRDTSS